MDEVQFEADNTLGSEEECYQCGEEPEVVLKQIQEFEYRDPEIDNDKNKVRIYICEFHHNMLIQKGAEMV